MVLEELGDERGRQVHGEGLVVVAAVLSDESDGLGGDGEEEARDVDELGVLHDGLDGVGIQMLLLVAVGGGEVGDHGPFLVLDEDSAGAGFDLFVDLVVHGDTVGFSALLELGTVFVLADATDEAGSFGGLQHPLSNSDTVLGSATGNVLDLVVLDEFVIYGLVLVFAEDGVVQSDTIPKLNEWRS